MTELTALIVEDDHDCAEAMTAVLSGYNLKTEYVQEGREALRYVNKKNPDITFMDLGLPDMSGEELIRVLRGIKYNNLIVIVSATSEEIGKKVMCRTRADYFVEKTSFY